MNNREDLVEAAKNLTGLEDEKEALFALACHTVQEYQLTDGEQVTLEQAERNLDTTLQAIKENLIGE